MGAQSQDNNPKIVDFFPVFLPVAGVMSSGHACPNEYRGVKDEVYFCRQRRVPFIQTLVKPLTILELNIH